MPPPSFPLPFGVMRTTLGLRNRLLDLVDLPFPPEVALWDFAAGMQRTQLAGVLVRSGLADALGSGRRLPAEVAGELDLDPEVTARVLGAAAGSRLVRFDRGGRVRLARLGRPLRRDHPRSIASWVGYQATAGCIAAFGQLEAQLRGGAEPSGWQRGTGRSLWDYLDEHPEDGVLFGEAMSQLTEIDVAPISRAYPWPQQGVICDVAGGNGRLLAEILKRRASATGILVDTPEVLAGAEAVLSSHGVEDRVRCVPGNFFGEIDASADVYVLKWVLHDWSDERCREILRRVRATMPSGSTIVTIDQRLDRDKPSPVTSLVDMRMLVECDGGRERSPGEVQELMRDVGLTPGQVRYAGLQMLVEGTAP